MSALISEQEILGKIRELNSCMRALARRYLDGVNVVFTIRLAPIGSADPSDIGPLVKDPEDGIRAFLRNVIQCPARKLWRGRDAEPSPPAASIDEEELLRIFAEPFMEKLWCFQPAFYAPTDAANEKYEALLQEDWLLDMRFVSVQSMWFLLYWDWVD